MDMKSYLIQFYIDQNGEVITPELACSLVQDMAITDGSDRTTGEKYTMEESKSIGDKLGVDWQRTPLPEWYVVLNSMYSDYYSVGRKHGMTDSQFFGELAKAWFEDVDAEDDKTFKYYFE